MGRRKVCRTRSKQCIAHAHQRDPLSLSGGGQIHETNRLVTNAARMSTERWRPFLMSDSHHFCAKSTKTRAKRMPTHKQKAIFMIGLALLMACLSSSTIHRAGALEEGKTDK